MKRYEKYKNSGVEWIGEIPEGWEIRKFGSVSYMKGRIGWQGLKQSEFTKNKNDPFLITGMNFHDGKIRWNEVYHITEDRYDEASEIQLYDGDVLFTKDGTIGKLLFVNKIPYPHKASLNSHLLVLRPLYNEYYPRYLYYQLQGLPFKHHVELTKTGTTFFGITQEAMGHYKVILPSLNNQAVIANYLDRKTAEIDELIAQKERLLELYEEEKTAIINQAVTQGINPDVKLKDSGIDWLGKIPENWEVKPLKMATKIIRGKFGHRPRNDPDFYEGEYPFIQTGDVAGAGKYIKQFHQTLNEQGFAISQEFPINTLVMTIAANIGDLAILSFKACFPDSIVGFYPLHRNSSEFLYYLFSSMKTEFLRVSTNNTQLNINIDRISPLKIPVPSLTEQTAIVQHIETETARINTKITKTKKIISLQKEYRTALISEVVTGKIRVTEERLS